MTSHERPLVFAHRGGAALAPENTLAAFDRGVACGADGLELDVRLSRDGVVVVHHDSRLERTTSASGLITDRDASELAALDASAGFVRAGGVWSGGDTGIPTLREVLVRYPDHRLIIELKGRSAVLARAAVREVLAAGAERRTCIGGFSWRAVAAERRVDSRVVTSASQLEVRAALYGSWLGLPPRLGCYAAFQVPEVARRTRVVTPAFVRLAHRAGRVVQVWTVDAPEDIGRLLDWGVDAVITDRPDVAVASRDRWLRRTGRADRMR